MLTLYCPNCAAPNFYTLNKPNFCANCAVSFSSFEEATAQTLKKPEVKPEIKLGVKNSFRERLLNKRAQAEAQNIEENEITELPDINELQIEPLGEKPKGIRFGDLVEQGAKTKKGAKDNIDRPKGKKMSKKEILAEFKSEASNLKRNTEVEDNGEE
jgi:hypothetical protein